MVARINFPLMLSMLCMVNIIQFISIFLALYFLNECIVYVGGGAMQWNYSQSASPFPSGLASDFPAELRSALPAIYCDAISTK